MKSNKFIPILTAALALPGMAVAQNVDPAVVQSDMVFVMNSVLFLVGGFLVFRFSVMSCTLAG